MRTLAVSLMLLAIVGAGRSTTAASSEATIDLGPETAVIRIGDEIAGTYRFGKDLPKPYLIAVSAPGAIDLLLSELEQPVEDEHAPGHRVFVAVEQAELRSSPDASGSEQAEFGAILDIAAAREGWLQTRDSGRWIQARDVVPLKRMVTRLVNLQPPSIKDRAHPLYYDHPHHKGVWTSIDEVNGIKFWAEEGRIANVSVDKLPAEGGSAGIRIVNHWLARDGAPLVIETTTLRVTPDRLFSYDIVFAAGEQAVTFEDTKEGLFAIRLPNSMREAVAHGPVTDALGRTGTKAIWGRAAPWVDYVGPVGGHAVGVTLMDHPSNPRKSRYHVRDYGLFSINPFGPESYSKGTDDAQPADPVKLAPGESIRFRYGLYIHAGDAAAGQVAARYQQFAATP